jgi:hypothetical protein
MMNPDSSRSSTPAKASVCGLTPMNTNIATHGMTRSACMSTDRTTTEDSDVSPFTHATSTPHTPSMFGVARIRSARYCDIIGCRSLARMSIVTRLA